jgi:diadenosine tetraphosphate (Ap4A) HIT family hydrolase
MHSRDCRFCDPKLGHPVTDHFKVVEDKFPVTPGHQLIVTNRHAADFRDLTPAEQADLMNVASKQIERLGQTDPTVVGFNIGMNCGLAAGQTVMHFHCHVIPRRAGDLDDPTGGVRGVIPDKRTY